LYPRTSVRGAKQTQVPAGRTILQLHASIIRLQKNPANFEIMTIHEQLLKENSKKNWNLVAKKIGTDKTLFKELMQIYFTDEDYMVLRASQVMSDISDVHPELLKPYLTKLIKHLNPDSIDAVRRNTMRVFQTLDIPVELEGELFEKGMAYLKSATEPKAVKAFSMTVLRRICEKYPDLCSELIPQIEILLQESASPGLVSRGEKELKKLRGIQK